MRQFDFTLAEQFSGIIPHSALRGLLERLPDRGPWPRNLDNRLLSCRGLNLIATCGNPGLRLTVEEIVAATNGRVVRGNNLETICEAGQVVSLAADPIVKPLVSDEPGILYYDPQLRLEATREPSSCIPVARITMDGVIDPWYWPELVAVDSHPLSTAATETLRRVIGDAPLRIHLAFQHAAELTWFQLLSPIISWLETEPERRQAIGQLKTCTSTCSLIKELVKVIAGGEVLTSAFPRQIEITEDGSLAEFVCEVQPSLVKEARPAGTYAPLFVHHAMYDASSLMESAGLYLAMVVTGDHASIRKASVMITQGQSQKIKDVTPRPFPVVFGELSPAFPFTVESRGGRVTGAALYRRRVNLM